MLKIYTDGSAHPNPGPGGYGIVVMDGDKIIKCYSEQFEKTTNNEMELLAIYKTLEMFGLHYPGIQVFSDSAYAINTYTKWMYSWADRGWIKSDKKVPENLTIIKNYYNLIREGYNIELVKIQGHNNIYGNELADALATGKMKPDEI